MSRTTGRAIAVDRHSQDRRSAVATSTNTLSPAHSTVSRRRLFTIGGGIVLAAAMVGGVAVAATLADSPSEPFAGVGIGVADGQLAQHVLRENGALLGIPAAAPDQGSVLRQHVVRENGAVATDRSDLHQHVLRENGATPSF
jgi:hypothetical protein